MLKLNLFIGKDLVQWLRCFKVYICLNSEVSCFDIFSPLPPALSLPLFGLESLLMLKRQFPQKSKRQSLWPKINSKGQQSISAEAQGVLVKLWICRPCGLGLNHCFGTISVLTLCHLTYSFTLACWKQFLITQEFIILATWPPIRRVYVFSSCNIIQGIPNPLLFAEYCLYPLTHEIMCNSAVQQNCSSSPEKSTHCSHRWQSFPLVWYNIFFYCWKPCFMIKLNLVLLQWIVKYFKFFFSQVFKTLYLRNG